jgi:hypothetical protein
VSIHQKGSVVTFKWVILPTGSPPLKPDFDIKVILSSNTSTYTNDGVTTYIAPTATTQGLVTYDLYLAQIGRYIVRLTTGVAGSFVVEAERTIFSVIVPEYVLNGTDISITQGPGVIPNEAVWVPPTHHTGLPDAVYSGNSKASQLFTTVSLYLKPEGDKIFLMRTGPTINQHLMSVAWQLDSTAQSGQRSLQTPKLGTDFTFALGVSPDLGQHVYACYDEIPAPSGDYNVAEHVTTTPWAINTFGTARHATLDASPTVEEAVGIDWSTDGTKCFLVDRATERVTEWDAGTPYQLETLVYNGVFYDFSGQASTLRDQFNLTVAWDLSTCSYSGDNFNCSPTCSDLKNIYVKPDETSFYVQDLAANRAYQFNM